MSAIFLIALEAEPILAFPFSYCCFEYKIFCRDATEMNAHEEHARISCARWLMIQNCAQHDTNVLQSAQCVGKSHFRHDVRAIASQALYRSLMRLKQFHSPDIDSSLREFFIFPHDSSHRFSFAQVCARARGRGSRASPVRARATLSCARACARIRARGRRRRVGGGRCARDIATTDRARRSICA